MTDYGLTPTGVRIKTYTEVRDEIGDKLKQNISPKLKVDDPKTVVSNLINPFADSISEVWALAGHVYNLLDVDNATRNQAIILGRMVGMSPLQADSGTVAATVNLDQGKVYAAESLLAFVEGEPENSWYNVDAIDTQAAGAPGNYTVTFRSTLISAKARAVAGTLTQRAASVAGWNSITNANDAEPGRDEETPEEMMLRRESLVAAQGSRTVGSIRARVAAVEGVQQVSVTTNRSSDPVDGIPGNSHRVVIFDGLDRDADDDEVAAAINSSAEGVRSFGSWFGTVTFDDGSTETEYFDRATTRTLGAAITVEARAVAVDLVKDAVKAAVKGLLGERVVRNKVEAKVLTISGVEDVGDLKFTYPGTSLPDETGNFTAAWDERFVVDTAYVVVTVVTP